MGTATNQIATQTDLYNRGFTFLGTGTHAVTHGDINNAVGSDVGKISSSCQTTYNITPTLNTSTTSVTYNGSYIQFVKIATYTIPAAMKGSLNKLINYSAPIVYVTGSTANVSCQCLLCLSTSASPTTTGSVVSGTVNVSSTTRFGVTFSPATAGNISIPTSDNYLYLYLAIMGLTTGSVSISNTYASNSFILTYIPLNKCVKYSDFYQNMVRKGWSLKIAENVTGSTRAHTIELRYYYKLTSSSTETYKVIGTWDYGSNISGSASAVHYFECNPYLILGSETTPYYAYLAIWCGSTNNRQTWNYKLRRGGSWDSSYTQASSSATSVLITYNKNTSNVGNSNFLSTMEYLSGVEFYID